MSCYESFRDYYPGHEPNAMALLALALSAVDRSSSNEAVLHRVRWKGIEDNARQGLLTPGDAQVQFNQSRMAVLDFIDRLEELRIAFDFNAPDDDPIVEGMALGPPKVFISYRRADSMHLTGRIRDRLAGEFGPDNVFFDAQSIELAEKFKDAILKFLDKADVFLAVIGPAWAGPKEGGGLRLQEEGDYVRMENERAMANGLPIVPLFVDGSIGKVPEGLPESLQPLFEVNGREILPDPRFDQDMVDLKQKILELSKRVAEPA